MPTLRSLPPIVLFLVCSLAFAGCRSPQSLCQEYVDSIRAMQERCGFIADFDVQHPRTGELGCHIVQQIPNPRPIVDECIPWADSIDTDAECATVSDLPSYCSARAFQIVE